MEKYLTIEEAARICGITLEAMRGRVKRNRDKLKLRKLRKAGGGYVLYISYSSLVNLGWVHIIRGRFLQRYGLLVRR